MTVCVKFLLVHKIISYLFPEEEKNESHLFGRQWFSATKMEENNWCVKSLQEDLCILQVISNEKIFFSVKKTLQL